MSEEKAKLIKDLNSAGIDINFIIQESFLGYKYRKKVNKLYEEKIYINKHDNKTSVHQHRRRVAFSYHTKQA